MNKRVSKSEVARILSLLAEPPNVRDDPDNPNYIQLFDGGLVKVDTGAMNYEFSDGTKAAVLVLAELHVYITFPDGRKVSIVQEKSGAYTAA
jgi:hypothetical protein